MKKAPLYMRAFNWAFSAGWEAGYKAGSFEAKQTRHKPNKSKLGGL